MKQSQFENSITTSRVAELLTQLINIPSLSGREGRLKMFVTRFLKRHVQSFDNQKVSRNRENLIAFGAKDHRNTLLLCTHLDTVPPFDDAQKVASIRGKRIYGRGACDAKGSLAAMLLAFEAAKLSVGAQDVPVTLALMVGEENSGDGVERFVQKYRKFPFAIVGEPTELQIVTTQAGYIEILLEAHAPRCHAFDPVVDQPILSLAEILRQIHRYVRSMQCHDFVRWIKGGNEDTFWYTRPECSASILINIFQDDQRPHVIKKIRAIVDQEESSSTGIRLRMKVVDWDNGVTVDKDSWGVRVLAQGMRQASLRPSYGHLPSWTDGSALSSVGIPTTIFGPGSLKNAHSSWEHVSVDDVKKAAVTLAYAITAMKQ